MKIYLDPVVIGTFAQLNGFRAFLETMESGIPTVEASEHQYLTQRAAEEGWEAGDYFLEKNILDEQFHVWIPTFAAYSAIILLHSIVETQLDALADQVGEKRRSTLRRRHLAGKGVERACNYLDLVLSIPVKTDPAWNELEHLQLLRNIVVHRAGRRGSSPEQREAADRLVRKYASKLDFRRVDFHEQLWISTRLCRDFYQAVDSFFERTFKAAGLPNRHGRMES